MVAERIDPTGMALEEKIVKIWRVAVVTKGGRTFSFAALAVVGNGKGVVGIGFGKAREVPNAIEKAVKEARKGLFRVATYGNTIPHEVRGKFGASEVIMIPALPGTGIIAGGAVRAVLECIGVHDALTKSVGGSNNEKNLVKATVDGLLQLRNRETVAELRGVAVAEDELLAKSLKAQATAKPKTVFQQDKPRGRRNDRRKGGNENKGAEQPEAGVASEPAAVEKAQEPNKSE